MRKLNNKGYLTVEIVLASVMAFAVAFFLMDLTIKLVNDTEDAYVDTVLTTDKGLIIKNLRNVIQNDIANYGKVIEVSEVETVVQERGNYIEWYIEFSTGEGASLIISPNEVLYESPNGSRYNKNINLKLSNINSNIVISGNYMFIKISGDNTFSDKNHDINIIIYNS